MFYCNFISTVRPALVDADNHAFFTPGHASSTRFVPSTHVRLTTQICMYFCLCSWLFMQGCICQIAWGGSVFEIRTGDRATVAYEHLVEGRLQCWSLHAGGSTGVIKIDPRILFTNSSRGPDISGKAVEPHDPPANTAVCFLEIRR